MISIILAEMKRKYLVTPPAPRKNSALMGMELDKYCQYHYCNGHNTDGDKILKRDIENMIQKGFLKDFVAWREESRSLRQTDRNVSPKRGPKLTRAECH